MKRSPRRDSSLLVFVTVQNRKVARTIARAVLESRTAACVNVLPGVESHYWWQGRIQQGKELLLLLKTTKARLGQLEAVVHQHHPYDTPEFVAVRLDAGSRRYLDWITASTTG